MTSRPNKLLYRCLALIGVLFGVGLAILSARGPASFPSANELKQVAGVVEWTELGRYSVQFGLKGDPRTFSYARKSGEMAAVLTSLSNRAAQPTTVWVQRDPQQVYEVYAFKDNARTRRSLPQVRAAWSTDYKFGYLAALLAFLAAGAIEYGLRRSQPNNSSKPTPLRGAA